MATSSPHGVVTATAAEAPPPPPDRRSLGEAITALYTSPDATVRAAADAWLQAYLRSEHAWPLSISLLRDAPHDLTSLEALFCARALHVLLRRCVAKAEKTQKSHAVLGDADWTGMRDALLPMAFRFAALNVVGGVGGGGGGVGGEAPPRTVLTQVALAISALACKMPNWEATTIVSDLTGYFLADPAGAPASAVDVVLRHGGSVVNGGGGNDRHGNHNNNGGNGGGGNGAHLLSPEGSHAVSTAGMACLLQILTVLPDECTSNQLSIHPARRAAVAEAGVVAR